MHPLWTMGQPSCSPRSSSSSPSERKFPAPPARSCLSSRGRLPCKSRSAPPGLCRPPRGRLRAGGTQKSPPSRGPDSRTRLDKGLAERPWATASPASVCGAARSRSRAARGPSGAQLPLPGSPLPWRKSPCPAWSAPHRCRVGQGRPRALQEGASQSEERESRPKVPRKLQEGREDHVAR
ncbi:glucocorticoid-induced transcript 1 protein-like [Molothrus ater]|uniref:glucocorticoid-induced transcript 1 protein-like n=1 Tax=Molothrus ater TaxID=84834 RepID=UPI00174AD820|nr:glucocorticoid-induced transcript 1 protein-like [Molothrus ater]